MATRSTHRLATGRPSDVGPAVTFAVTVLATFVALALATVTLPREAVMPALSYWDVAGALTLFGIFAGTLTEPDQLVRLIETQRPAD